MTQCWIYGLSIDADQGNNTMAITSDSIYVIYV